MSDIPARALLDIDSWQRLQNLIAEIISVNLWLIDAQASSLTHPSKINACCCHHTSDSYASPKPAPTDCILNACENWLAHQEPIFKCPHLLHFCVIPVEFNEHTVALMVGGPLIIGKRESDSVYTRIAKENAIRAHEFLDWIREVKVFSQHGLNRVMDLLKELSQYMLHSKIRSKLIFNSVFDIARQIVGADSGSFLVLTPEQNEFLIQSSYGLSAEVLKKEKLPADGIAGWAVSRKEPILIGAQPETKIPQDQLKRPEIRSSMIVPVEHEERVIGVICLNSNASNERFNKESVSLVRHLGRLATTTQNL